ncbi:hypothetical protein HLPCO_000987 [Haloplasma contractile SSD-17B]|uniref:Uncharacterized protein n=1 Tax=Haloplasma contractile SSD-17B TaxID=1033810 RepID=U2DWF7_9MOLU|nr:hypothetical protein HLPCO_000987 [Haloplasma contractile SSD-17B]
MFMELYDILCWVSQIEKGRNDIEKEVNDRFKTIYLDY